MSHYGILNYGHEPNFGTFIQMSNFIMWDLCGYYHRYIDVQIHEWLFGME